MPRPPSRPSHSISLSEVPRFVRGLIFLSIPTNVAGGFFFIYVSVFLLDLGVPPEIVGLVLAVNGACMVLSAIPLGILSDRKGRKHMLILGSFLFSPILLILALTTETRWLVVAGILGGISEAAFLSTWNAMIADRTPATVRNAAFSLSFIIGTTTSGVGSALPFVFPWMHSVTGISLAGLHQETLLIFAFVSLLTPAGLALLLRGYREEIRPMAAPRPTVGARLSGLRRRVGELRVLFLFSSLNGLVGLGAGFIIPLIGTWFRLRFGIPDSLSGPLLALSSFTMGLAGITSARLAKRYGSVRAIALVQGFATVLMFSLAVVPDALAAGIIYVIRAALMNMASPILDAYLMGLVKPDERGFASALNSIIWRMPNSVSTFGGGYLLGQGEYQLPFVIAGSLYGAGIALFFSAFRHRDTAVKSGDAGPGPAV